MGPAKHQNAELSQELLSNGEKKQPLEYWKLKSISKVKLSTMVAMNLNESTISFS